MKYLVRGYDALRFQHGGGDEREVDTRAEFVTVESEPWAVAIGLPGVMQVHVTTEFDKVFGGGSVGVHVEITDAHVGGEAFG